jgi:xanthine dehydrogenase YagR molybdenum-binding subunit
VTVETDMTDIGTGSYTIIAQTAAEMMGVPLHSGRVRLGDFDFPVSAGSGGQWGAASSTAGVYAACVKLREAVRAELGFACDCAFVDGQVRRRAQRAAREAGCPRRAHRRGLDRVRRPRKKYQQSTFAPPSSRSGRRLTAETRVRACSPSAPPAASSTEVGAQPGHRRDDDGRRRPP